MIRVNLMRTRVQDQGTLAQVPEDSDDARQTLVKVALMLMSTLALMAYESQNLSNLRTQSARLAAQVNTLEVQAVEKANEVEKVKDVAAQAAELEDKLKIMKLLSRLRLREVKALDFMQSSIPEKVWLRGLTFEADKVDPEKGQFIINGYAMGTDELSEFVARLEESAYLDDVIVIRNQEVAHATRNILLRDFMFTAEVEKN